MAVVLLLPFGCAPQKAGPATSQECFAEGPTFTGSAPPLFVDRASRFTYDLPIQNTGASPVHFVRLQPSCTCAGGTTLERMQLAPGEGTQLHFDIDVANRTGPQHFVCSLIEEDGRGWACQVRTAFYERVRLAEGRPLHFGMLEPGSQRERQADLCLFAPKGEAFPSDIRLATDSDCLQVKAGLASETEQADGVRLSKIPLTVSLKVPSAPVQGRASITVSFKDEKVKRTIRTPVDWSVRSRYYASPGSVYFGRVGPRAGPVKRRVRIAGADRRPVRLLGVEASCAGVTPALEPGRTGTDPMLVLAFDPTRVPGPVLGEVSVKIVDPVQPYLKIPIAAIVGESQ